MKGNPQLHFKNETVVDFKVPKGNPAYLKVLNKPAFPVFSNDAKFYTPSFILSKIEGLKDEDCQNLHKQKVE